MLLFNGDMLKYKEPKVLRAPYFKDQEGAVRRWRKDIEFDFGGGLSVRGFAALRAKASTKEAGLSLFRRGRVIQGSGDEGYRPPYIFGRSNSYRYQRLFGELHLDGFDVSHTKDGFRWDENEQPFLELLRDHLDGGDLPLLKQAEGYRVRVTKKKIKSAAETAVTETTRVMEQELPTVVPPLVEAVPVGTPVVEPDRQHDVASRRFDVEIRGRRWGIKVELCDDPGDEDWLTVYGTEESGDADKEVGMRLSLAHPFMVRFAQRDPEDLEGLVRVAAGIALAEILARDAGVELAGTVRRNLNELLRRALSEP